MTYDDQIKINRNTIIKVSLNFRKYIKAVIFINQSPFQSSNKPHPHKGAHMIGSTDLSECSQMHKVNWLIYIFTLHKKRRTKQKNFAFAKN